MNERSRLYETSRHHALVCWRGRAAGAGETNHVAGLRAPSPDTLVLELERGDPMFPYLLASSLGVAVPREEVERLGPDFSVRPVGDGPYLLQAWVRGARLQLIRNPHYHGPEPQHLDGIDLLIGGDETTHLMMFERGELDITGMQTRRSVPCAYCGWSQDYPDPSNFLDVVFNGTRIQDFGGNNYSYYSNPEVNRLFAEADRIAVPAERNRQDQLIENLILQDAPVVPLVHPAVPVLISPRIGGFRPHPVWQMQLEHWWALDSPKK